MTVPEFQFHLGQKVIHSNTGTRGVVIGLFVDQSGVEHALVEYTTTDARVVETYWPETALTVAERQD